MSPRSSKIHITMHILALNIALFHIHMISDRANRILVVVAASCCCSCCCCSCALLVSSYEEATTFVPLRLSSLRVVSVRVELILARLAGNASSQWCESSKHFFNYAKWAHQSSMCCFLSKWPNLSTSSFDISVTECITFKPFFPKFPSMPCLSVHTYVKCVYSALIVC